MRTPPAHLDSRSTHTSCAPRFALTPDRSPTRAGHAPPQSESSAAASSGEVGPSEPEPDLVTKRAEAVAQAIAEGLTFEASDDSGSGYKSVRKRVPRRGHGMRTTFEARFKRKKSWETLGVFSTVEEAALVVARKQKSIERRAETKSVAPAVAAALPPRKRPRSQCSTGQCKLLNLDILAPSNYPILLAHSGRSVQYCPLNLLLRRCALPQCEVTAAPTFVCSFFFTVVRSFVRAWFVPSPCFFYRPLISGSWRCVAVAGQLAAYAGCACGVWPPLWVVYAVYGLGLGVTRTSETRMPSPSERPSDSVTHTHTQACAYVLRAAETHVRIFFLRRESA